MTKFTKRKKSLSKFLTIENQYIGLTSKELLKSLSGHRVVLRRELAKEEIRQNDGLISEELDHVMKVLLSLLGRRKVKVRSSHVDQWA